MRRARVYGKLLFRRMAFMARYFCTILFRVLINLYGHRPFAGWLFRAFIFVSHVQPPLVGGRAQIDYTIKRRHKIIKVSILGTEYDICQKDMQEDTKLEDMAGYCDSSVKEIVICNPTTCRDSKKDIESVRKKIVRHEIIHAFLFESGLDVNSDWGTDETLVDWIALQFPKLTEAFKTAGCL